MGSGHMDKGMTLLLVSERMIEAIPASVLVDYVELRLKLRTGVIFRAKRAAQKMGWSERRMYQCIASQKHWGLLKKDQYGHHQQCRSVEARRMYQDGGPTRAFHSHKTTLKLKTSSTRQEIADLLKFKLAEARRDQFLWAQQAAMNTSHRLRSKNMKKGFNEKNIWVRPDDHPADAPMLELCAGKVSMTMKELARTTLQSERSAYRWKKRVRRLLVQENREVFLDPGMSNLLDHNEDVVPILNDRWKGTLVRKGSRWKLVLPNTYVFKPTYDSPKAPTGKSQKRKPDTKYQSVVGALKSYSMLQSQYKEKLKIEYQWYVDALANH